MTSLRWTIAGALALGGCFSPESSELDDTETGTSGTEGTSMSGTGTTTEGTTTTTEGTSASTTDPTAGTGDPDTTPPTIEEFTVSPTLIEEARFVDLSATVTDDVAVDRVEFYRGDELIGTVTDEPYALAWRVKTDAIDGEHQVRCIAFDTSSNSAESDAVAVGIDLPERGTELWHDVVPAHTTVWEAGKAIAFTEGGRAIVAGSKANYNALLSITTPDIWLREYSVGGTETWTVTNDAVGYAHDGAEAIAIDPMGYIVVAGWTREGDALGNATGPRNVRVIRFAPGGQSIDWARTYGEATEEWIANGVGVDGTGRVFVGGTANGNAWVARLDPSDGAIDFEDTFMSVNGASSVNDLAADGDGNFVVIGNEAEDIWLRRYNADESVAWTKTVDGPDQEFDRGYGVAMGPDGRIGAVGQLQSFPPNGSVWITVYDSDGTVEWSTTHDSGSGDEDAGRDIAFDPDGEVVVTASVEVVHNGLQIWVARYAPDAPTLLWEASYNGSTTPTGSDDYGYGVAVDEVGYVYVTGSTHQWSNPTEPGWDPNWNSAVWVGKFTP